MLAHGVALRGILAAGVILAALACGAEPTSSKLRQPSVEKTQPFDCPGCLLKQRIASAPPGATIKIAAGIYTLTGGELVIDKDLTLVGEGPDVTVIQAANTWDDAVHRVIRITEGSVVSISGVTIRYGNEASTKLRMIPFHSAGIGMPSSGIEGISAEFGGGVYNQGTLTLSDSVVTENFAGGGGGIFNGAKITIRNTLITGNKSPGYGGGIFNGGILHAVNIVLEDNVAGTGAGINNWGDASLVGAIINRNRADSTGGGIQNSSIGVMTLDSSTVSHNGSVVAGGIYNFGWLEIVNGTISNNAATSAAGIHSRGTLTLANSTINGNSGRDGGGLVVRPFAQSEGVRISNTILAGNTAVQGPDCVGAVISLGHNLIGIDSLCELIAVDGDQIGTTARPIDPKLDGLSMNGGQTATNALLPGSPAIDAADSGACPPVDQRGVKRPRGPSCDIGSYER